MLPVPILVYRISRRVLPGLVLTAVRHHLLALTPTLKWCLPATWTVQRPSSLSPSNTKPARVGSSEPNEFTCDVTDS